MENVGCPMGQKRVTLHLAQADASAEFAPLNGLLGQLVVGAGGADLSREIRLLKSIQIMSLPVKSIPADLSRGVKIPRWTLISFPLHNSMLSPETYPTPYVSGAGSRQVQ